MPNSFRWTEMVKLARATHPIPYWLQRRTEVPGVTGFRFVTSGMRRENRKEAVWRRKLSHRQTDRSILRTYPWCGTSSRRGLNSETQGVWWWLGRMPRQVSALDSRRRLRSAATDTVVVPPTRLSTVGDRAFSVAAARAWNSLPSTALCAPSLEIFRHAWKLNFSRAVSCHLTFRLFASTLFNFSYLAISPTLLGVLAVTLWHYGT